MPSELETPPPPQRSVIYDVEGGVIAEIYDRNRELVKVDDVAPVMRDAIISTEDSRFYEHGGLDISGTFRAALRTVSGSTQGGSSLTQQYVKNVLIEGTTSEAAQAEARETTLSRKVRELRYAVSLEEKMSKDEILEGYLNIAYFGDGAYGAESAAQHFFSKPASELNLGEAATLAGLVRYPELYNPRLNPEQATERRDVVLDRMVDTESITQEEADEFKGTELKLDISTQSNGCVPSKQPFFCDYVIQEIEKSDKFGETETERARWLRTAGLQIHTTLDPDMQAAGQKAVDKWVPRKNESRKVAAEVFLEPGTGQIRVMAQSRNYGPDESKIGETSINFATNADRGGSSGFQAGSTFKAITLAAALDQGMPYSTSFTSGSSTTITGQKNCNGAPLASWSLSNSSESKGATTHNMVSGTKASANTYFAHLQKRVGLCNVIKMAEKLGVTRADGQSYDNDNTQSNNSFTLGSEEVSPMSVANAYATFAARGVYCKPQAITKIDDRQSGKTIELDSDCERRISKETADGVNYLLQQTFNGGTASSLGIGRPVAGKTGTTDGSASAWFAGYTPNLAGAVFVGDPRGPNQHPLRNITLGGRYFGTVYGATIPGPIWRETMQGSIDKLDADNFSRSPSRFGSTSEPAPPAPEPSPAAAQPTSDQGGVPNVVGQQRDSAVAALEAAGYRVNVSETPIRSDQAQGTVAAVNPNPGTRLPEGAAVNVFLSNGGGGDTAAGFPGAGTPWTHGREPDVVPVMLPMF
ncbi:penicillin-binding protein [Nocardiopsis ansamitocini]|nr:penicillin-binding protein [Nocardiopsis ansamitocini]